MIEKKKDLKIKLKKNCIIIVAYYSYLQPQIWINIQVGRRIVLVFLLQPAVICLLEIKNKFIKLK